MKIVGIRFKPAGKVYDFDAGAFVLNQGDYVIVETEHGLGMGTVTVPPVVFDEKNDTSRTSPTKKVFRVAGEKDFFQREKNRETEKAAHDFCLECVKELKLDMNLFAVESTFDASKLTFFFTAEGRIDFRQLVKLLIQEFHTRIEMRQVGIRHKAKMCGGIGRCGRTLCCATFMEKFEPVSIRMAKEQGLSLNPTKISGLCGRLMCCLTFENETYLALKEDCLKKNWPKPGRTVQTPRGKGKVIRHNVICNRLAIRLDSGDEVESEVKDCEVIE
ncbi:MAG: stage 0 sporulation protein [Desulfobacterales bacterium]|nr:stage 0 sporulation protein [Desulfobacterales bacterium]